MLINELIGNYFAKVYRANTACPYGTQVYVIMIRVHPRFNFHLELFLHLKYGGHPINRENCLLFCKTLPLIGVYYFHLKDKHLVSLQNKLDRI